MKLKAKKRVVLRFKVPKFSFSLQENAVSSLIQGVRHFTARGNKSEDLKFAVMHIFHSIELFLKGRLVKEHRLLIYSKPECPITEQAQTVRFDELVNRLKNTGVHLPENVVSVLGRLKRVRNSIEHFQISRSKDEVKDYVGSAARFLEKFLKDEMGLKLEKIIDEETYRVLSESIHTYEERLAKAEAKFSDALPGDGGKGLLDTIIDACPECGEETVSPNLVDDSGLAECYFCHEKFYFQECPRCGQSMYSAEKFDEDNDPGVCEGCWANRLEKD